MNKRSQLVMLLCLCVAAGFTLAAVAAPVTTTYTYDKIGNIKLVGNTSSDPANCGAVSNACAAGDPCCGGTCRVSEPTNCGGCGVSCSSNHVTPACSGGSCAAGVCAAGWGDCNGNKQGDGCETALNTTANCGGCGIACSMNHLTPACSGGWCAASVCTAGWGDCNGNKQADGCETDLATSTAHCGGCGIACSANHVTPACSGGSCAAGVCAAGWGDCNGNKQADGCETDLATSTANCGGCGIACSANHATPACSGGSCAAGVCAAGWGDCNGNKQADGCETPLITTSNCGACGRVCAAGQVCSGGACVTSPPPPKPKTCSGGRICCEPDGAGGCLVCAPRGGQCP